ncbi:DNA polymerase III subunit delta [Tropicimonas sp. IMCC6043]|uniref:DNA polymerase III subunit delta n=1 Tax=Tropicimonas sp. IMCC6043 TaxID=2510645 RepID=UPI00101BFC57|nr:DNA polymerase III subunit delta [Tropicimonas sp. IMCC6043]RYH09092.1 DNA polymerase III subunit delta [Tropicimonas sp. IMCC6043]
MKLSSRDANAFFAKPDVRRAGLLIYGADAMRVALRRQDLVAALIGPEGDSEMRLTRMQAAELRRDGAALTDEVKATGFFPGQRVVLVEEAGDAQSAAIAAALDDWSEGDAMIVVTAGTLAARSKLRKLFEDHSNALAAAIYDDPPSRAEIEAELKRAGLARIDPAAMGDLEALARALDPGDFRQTLEKISLYKRGDSEPLTSGEIAALAPATIEAAVDDVLHAVAEGRDGDIGPLMQKLGGQGETPVYLTIAALRHFRALHAAAADPKGPAAGIARQRPPVFGPRRDRMIRQAQGWSPDRLDRALSTLIDTDLALRSAGQTAPQMALVERAFLRLAHLKTRGR